MTRHTELEARLLTYKLDNRSLGVWAWPEAIRMDDEKR